MARCQIWLKINLEHLTMCCADQRLSFISLPRESDRSRLRPPSHPRSEAWRQCDRRRFRPGGGQRSAAVWRLFGTMRIRRPQEFGVRFRLLDNCKEKCTAPRFGTVQQFLYCLCRIE